MNMMESMKNLELEHSNNRNSGNTSNYDECDVEEIRSVFSEECKMVQEKTVLTKEKYILHIDGTNDTTTLAVGSSDSNVHIFNLNGAELISLDVLTTNDGQCMGVSFVTGNNNLLYSGYNNGSIKLWDLRDTKRHVTNFVDSTAGNAYKPFSCFDVSNNNRLLAAGTELCKGDAFVLFWDVRKTCLLGGYWESHSDDITQLKFNDYDDNRLMSSSTDGLINVYDLSQSCEDDALIESLNTESSVEQVAWFRASHIDCIFSSMHTSEVQLWRLADAEQYAKFKRNALEIAIKTKSKNHSYIAGIHCDETKNHPFILVGSNDEDGECIRSLKVDKNELQPCHDFTQNRQRVRASWFNAKSNILLTGGEKGILNTWKINFSGLGTTMKIKKEPVTRLK